MLAANVRVYEPLRCNSALLSSYHGLTRRTAHRNPLPAMTYTRCCKQLISFSALLKAPVALTPALLRFWFQNEWAGNFISGSATTLLRCVIMGRTSMQNLYSNSKGLKAFPKFKYIFQVPQLCLVTTFVSRCTTRAGISRSFDLSIWLYNFKSDTLSHSLFGNWSQRPRVWAVALPMRLLF